MNVTVSSIGKSGMPAEWKKLFLLYLVIYLLDFQVRDWLKADSIAEILAQYSQPHIVKLQFTGFLAFGFFAFATYWVFRHFYEKQSGWVVMLLVFGTAVLGILFRAFLEEGLLKALTGYGNYNPNLSWGYYFRDNSIYAITYCSLGGIFFLVRYAAFQVKMREQTQLALRETELRFLRSQVNPHFLFNTLNNLYAMVNRGSDKALTTIEKLSGLLRYSLYEQQGMVPIAQEIKYLKDLIHLEVLRIDAAAPIVIQIEDFETNYRLPPLLLVPFVENAFKHGDLKDPSQPLSIYLAPNDSGGLNFSVKNKVNPTKVSKDGTGGIGILNVEKRLALLYPERHALNIFANDSTYSVQLQING